MNSENLRPIVGDEKKRILVEVLEKLDRIFSKNDITYYLAYGTLLGAVRHKGFIPWDDDIDLLVPRKDFIKLIELLAEPNNEFENQKLEIVEFGQNKKNYYKRFKIADTRTVMEEFGEERSALFVDIFPLDCFPNMPVKKLRKMAKKVVLIDNLCSLCNANAVQATGIKKIIYAILLCIHRILGCERMKKYYITKEIEMTKYRENGVICYSNDIAIFDQFMDISAWEKTTLLPFEGKMFNAPEGYDIILKTWYGDYMQLPPENERHSHEYYTMYWRENE